MKRKQDHGVLLTKFKDGRERPALRRGHRGQIDPACRLPTLDELLRIDRAAEQAVARFARRRAIGGRGD